MSGFPAEFRKAVSSRNRAGGRRRRYGADLRTRAAAYVEESRHAGRGWSAISSELGVSVNLLQRWCRQRRSTFARVEVTAEHPESLGPLRVKTPAGYEIEGLSVVEAAELLRALDD